MFWPGGICILLRVCTWYQTDVFSGVFLLFSSGRGSSLALSAAWHVGSPRVHHGGNASPDRGPQRVLWAFEVANFRK